MVLRICQVCGKKFHVIPFEVKRGHGKYCSRECSDESKKAKVKRICQTCDKEFYVVKSAISRGKGKYCSPKCFQLSRRGKKLSEKHKENLSKSYIKYLASSRSKGRGKTFDTKIELAVEAELRSREIKYIKQYNAEGIACVDFFIPEHKIIIQCDGNYWHSRGDHKQRDFNQDFRLRFKGYKIFRFWESEINKDVKGCIDKVNRRVRSF